MIQSRYRMVNILLGVSGSVAAIKAGQVVSQLKEKVPGCQVQIVATEHSMHFLDTVDNVSGVSFAGILNWNI